LPEKSSLDEALKHLNHQVYTEKKLANKLEDAGFPDEEISESLSRLKNWGYINDLEFGTARIQQLQDRLKSRSYTILDLEKQGLAKETIVELVNCYYPEDRELEIAEKLIARKAISSKKQAKMWVCLVRNGFSENTVHHCFPSIDPT
jgi:regulatory protein